MQQKKLNAEIIALQSSEHWKDVTTLTRLRRLRLETYQNLDQSKQIIQKLFGCEFKFECIKVFLTRFLWNIETFNSYGLRLDSSFEHYSDFKMNVKITLSCSNISSVQ